MQEECVTDIVVDTDEGGGSTVTEEYEYEGPFKVTFDNDHGFWIDGPDISGSTYFAGQIYRCGVFDEEYGAKKGGIGAGFIYAHVTDDDIVYDNSASLEEEVAGGTTEIIDCYTVRLGSGAIIPATTVEMPVLVDGATVYKTVEIAGLTTGSVISGTEVLDYDVIPGNTNTIRYFDVAINGATVEVPVANGATINQYHMGDIYVDCPEDIPIPPGTASYNGPFMLTAGGMVTCGVCPTEGTGTSAKHVAGYYSINGTGYAPVYDKVVELTGDTTSIFFNISGTTGATIETTGCTAPDCYSVWIGDITGATESVVEGTTTYGNATGVRQYQYGNIHVDGRWS